MKGLGFTISFIDGKWRAACHHCAIVQVRTHDRVGLILAADRHVSRRH